MTLKELLEKDIGLYDFPEEFKNYVKSTGLNKVRKKDLDTIIEKFGVVIFNMTEFSDTYKLVSSDETNRTMQGWTKAIGYLTIAIAIMTLIMTILTYIRN